VVVAVDKIPRLQVLVAQAEAGVALVGLQEVVHLEQQIKVLRARIVLLIVILVEVAAVLLIMPVVLLVEMVLGSSAIGSLLERRGQSTRWRKRGPSPKPQA
jgi:hypothetical protein